MKNLSLVVWLTQLGLSVAVPLLGFVWLGIWLRSSCGWGLWALLTCVALGVILAVNGLRQSLKLMDRLANDDSKTPPAVSFNEHE